MLRIHGSVRLPTARLLPTVQTSAIIGCLLSFGRVRYVSVLSGSLGWRLSGLGDLPRPDSHMPDERDPVLGKSLHFLQETTRRSGPAATASYTLIGAILFLGGIGYLVDHWQDTSPWFLLAGLLGGLVVGFYELAKIVWKP